MPDPRARLHWSGRPRSLLLHVASSLVHQPTLPVVEGGAHGGVVDETLPYAFSRVAMVGVPSLRSRGVNSPFAQRDGVVMC